MKKFIGADPQGLLRAILFPAVASVVLSIAVGWLAIQRIDEAYLAGRENAFNLETSEIALKIEERFKAYRQVLRGARALFAASREVTRAEWKEYVSGLRLQADFGGIQGVGFAVPVPAAQLASHEQRIRAEGFPDYRVSPPGKRDFYTAIVYLEPFDWRNQRAFGYDMYSEPVRREAMERARALGVPALSGRVRLVQETSSDVQAGVLLYLPVFQRGAPLETPAQRDQAFMGWVYAPFRLGDLMLGTLGDAASRIRIYDGHREDPATLLFDSAPGQARRADLLTRRSVLELDNQTWTLIFDEPPEATHNRRSAAFEKGAVVLIGALFVLLAVSFTAARHRAVALDRTSASLRASEARYSSLVNLSHDGIAALDRELRFTFVNPRLDALLGYPPGYLVGRPVDCLWPEPDAPRLMALATRLRQGAAATYEQELRRADGGLLTAIVTDAPHLDGAGELQGAILTITDISARKASEQRIHYLATHDTLTGLANRAQFLDQMNTSLLLAMRKRTQLALLFLDLDRFKEVNDTLGHAAGDALLIEAARRMQLALRASDLLARQGGDEFMILLHDIHGTDEAAAVAAKIRQAIDRPFLLEGTEQHISVSIGIALFPDDGSDTDTLTRHADAAMYRTKAARRRESALPARTAPGNE
ncbi:CHASE domain-containing protein [Zoogloea sp.]|uniref:CHASE domain-containing protein n=1 Tax=Zoogloea sp. TaxID=49181 RepID=UPI0035B44805